MFSRLVKCPLCVQAVKCEEESYRYYCGSCGGSSTPAEYYDWYWRWKEGEECWKMIKFSYGVERFSLRLNVLGFHLPACKFIYVEGEWKMQYEDGYTEKDVPKEFRTLEGLREYLVRREKLRVFE